jgi:hypothetical protein
MAHRHGDAFGLVSPVSRLAAASIRATISGRSTVTTLGTATSITRAFSP